MKSQDIGPWQYTDDAWLRAVANSDGSLPYRLAFIEKTPRVRVAPYTTDTDDHLKWLQGPKGSGPDDMASHDWCDKMLAFLETENGQYIAAHFNHVITSLIKQRDFWEMWARND